MWVLAIPFLWRCYISFLISVDFHGCQTIREQEFDSNSDSLPQSSPVLGWSFHLKAASFRAEATGVALAAHGDGHSCVSDQWESKPFLKHWEHLEAEFLSGLLKNTLFLKALCHMGAGKWWMPGRIAECWHRRELCSEHQLLSLAAAGHSLPKFAQLVLFPFKLIIVFPFFVIKQLLIRIYFPKRNRKGLEISEKKWVK